MPRAGPSPANGRHSLSGAKGGNRTDRLQLLRNSHIFASAIQDILQLDLLRRSSSYPLTPAQLQLLRLIGRNGDHMLAEAAEILGVSPPAASKHIDRLESYGLVRRERSTGDRRVTLLSVSDEGLRVVRKYDELTREQLGAALAAFEPGEIEWLSSLLERLSVSLLDESDAMQGFCLRCGAYLSDECPVGILRGGCPHGSPPEYTSGGGAEDYV